MYQKPSSAPRITFTYQGKDKLGGLVEGRIQSTHLSLAKAELRKQGITPLHVKRQSNFALYWRHHSIPRHLITSFTRQFATMISAGVPIVQSLQIIREGSHHRTLQELLTFIQNDLKTGIPLSQAFMKYPRYFEPLYSHFIEAGEIAGALSEMLERLALYREKSDALKRKIKKALFYPVLVASIATIVTFILLVFVIPQFHAIFKSFNAPLPTFTVGVLAISYSVQHYWYLFMLFLGAAIFILKHAYCRSYKVRAYLDHAILKLPLFGMLIRKAIIARFSRTLATTYKAGVPLLESLMSLSSATRNTIYKEAFEDIYQNVKTGVALHGTMKNTFLFPPMVHQMIAIGEESGSLDSMLSKIATIFEEEVEVTVDSLSRLIEPLIIIVLGLIIGSLIIAMYLPIFNLGSII